MRQQKGKKKQQASLTLEAWLQNLEKQFKSFQKLYELKKQQEAEESKEQESVSVPSIADHYFERVLTSYLALIEIVGDYVRGNPLKLLELFTSKDERLAQLLGFIDIRRFVPRLFHPHFETNEGQGYYVMRMDQNCYRLALTIQGAIEDLKKVEGGLYGLVKKKFNDRVAKIMFALRNRIERYEFNLHFLKVKTEADECNAELLILCGQAKQSEPDYENIAKQLNALLDRLLALPIAAPEYQLDGSVITIDAKEGPQRGNEITFTRYPTHVMEFLLSQSRSSSESAQRLVKMQSQDLFNKPSICNVYLVDASVQEAQTLLAELKSHLVDNTDLNAVEEKLVALQQKRDAEEVRFQPVGENNQWAKAIHERLQVFLEAFKQYANFDPEAFSLFSSSSELAEKALGREVYEELSAFLQMTESYNDCNQWALEAVFNDLAAGLVDSVKEFYALYKKNILPYHKTPKGAGKAMLEYIDDMKPLMTWETYSTALKEKERQERQEREQERTITVKAFGF